VDADETFTRDMLRAMQTCDSPQLDYEEHSCHPQKMGIRAKTRIFETSPECATATRAWFHPSAFVGHCIEEVGNEAIHPKAPRVSEGHFMRAEGFGNNGWGGLANVTDGKYPLYSGGDYRRVGASHTSWAKSKEHAQFTGFHFHNFFTHPDALRFKYRTYGHQDRNAYSKTLEQLHPHDLGLMVNCVQDRNDSNSSKYKREAGGFETLQSFRPIYFEDADYRARRHASIRDMVIADNREFEAKRDKP
jgi:hypothetical protein